jgi:hypothetical protein
MENNNYLCQSMKRLISSATAIITLLLLSSIILGSCKKEDTEAFIRVRNASAYKYTNTLVNTSGGMFNYGTMEPDQTSSYQSFIFAYVDALVQVEINTQELTLIPNSYEGENRLASGYYTYVIDVVDLGNGELSLELIKD